MTTTTTPATREPVKLNFLFDAIAKADTGDAKALERLRGPCAPRNMSSVR